MIMGVVGAYLLQVIISSSSSAALFQITLTAAAAAAALQIIKLTQINGINSRLIILYSHNIP